MKFLHISKLKSRELPLFQCASWLEEGNYDMWDHLAHQSSCHWSFQTTVNISRPQLVIWSPCNTRYLLFLTVHTSPSPGTDHMSAHSQLTQVQVLVLIIYQLDPVLTIILRLKSQLSNIYKSVVIKINYLDPVHANITQMEPRTDWSPDCHLTNCLSCDWSCQGCI